MSPDYYQIEVSKKFIKKTSLESRLEIFALYVKKKIT